jgi:conjugal transfer pilus assembly protein TrbC
MLFSLSIYANQPDYEHFAAEQNAKKSEVIAQYQDEIRTLVNSAGRKEPRTQLVSNSIISGNITPLPNNKSVTNEYRTSDVIIFVSFSMPKESIKTWALEANKIGANVVIKGLVNNSFKDTIATVYEFIKDNQARSVQAQGVVLDPTLFEKFHINKVPAVVVADHFDNYDVVYGDVTLDYALSTIANYGDLGKKTEMKSPIYKALAVLRGNKHG